MKLHFVYMYLKPHRDGYKNEFYQISRTYKPPVPSVHTFHFPGSLGWSKILLLPINHKNKIHKLIRLEIWPQYCFLPSFFYLLMIYFFCTLYLQYSILMSSVAMIEKWKGPLSFNVTILKKQRQCLWIWNVKIDTTEAERNLSAAFVQHSEFTYIVFNLSSNIKN